jgi:hypothetical protein
MLSALAPKFGPRKCPSCDAKLNVDAHRPQATAKHCPECQIYFPDAAPRPNAHGRPARQKKISCPRCADRFVAAIFAGNKVQCPTCDARITIRKSGADLKRPAENAARRSAVGAPSNPSLDSGFRPKTTRLASGALRAPTPPVPKTPEQNNSQRAPAPLGQTLPRPSSGRANYSLNRKALALAGLLLLITGSSFTNYLCFSEVKHETVQGTVTFDGKSVPFGSVVMQGEDGVSRTGTINPDGSYTVAKVPHGKVRVAVFSIAAPSSNTDEASMPSESTEEPKPGSIPSPEIYIDINRTEIVVTVEGETRFDIDLTTTDSAAEPAPF